MRIKVAFEIGHSAQLKAKASPEGFTHDWELFVRGADGNNINRFVEKIVFNLHESFPKPCRVYKDPPYVLKESGYASFNLPIDIYLKAGPRDDPKKFSITYDLDISKTTVQKYPLTISNPSSDFRHKLLEGGGIMLNNDVLGHPSDDRPFPQPDSTTKPRPQSSSSGVGSSGGGKKHKIKTDDLKPTSTFENLFGSPILNSKNSPDPKLSNNNSSSSSSKVPTSSSANKIPSQKSSKERSSEKSSKEKRDKKDKSGNTPKEGSKESSSSKKNDEKHERREEKRKEKSSTKDRERSKEKSSKRPPSPKPTSRSPKRSASPPRASSSNSNRHENLSTKYDEKSSSSLGKKSKKEKRDKSKDRERTSGEKIKDSKHQMQQKNKDEKPINKSMEKLNGSSKKDENESKERDKSNKYRLLDKPPSPLDVPPPPQPIVKIPTPTDSKKSHDKDERKHKHKKKDKNKEKDRKKSKTKEIANESPSSRKRSNVPTPTINQINRIPNAKINTVPILNPQTNQLSDKSSSDFDDDDYMDRISPKPDKVSSSNDTNQSSMDHLIEPIPDIVTPRSNHTDSPKKSADKISGKKTKEPKSNQSSSSKEEKKKKRKNKTDKKHDDIGGGSGKRKTQSPIGCDEPPAKFFKKDDEKLIPKIKDENLLDTKLLPGRTPPVPQLIASPSTQKLYHQSPDSSKQVNIKRNADNLIGNQTKKSHISSPTTSASSSPSSSAGSASPQQIPQAESPSEKQYMAQLKALQHKIMSLRDNDELQQVVEMIAATGCYEVTQLTFDFDLCALDRNTVQRLQERLG